MRSHRQRGAIGGASALAGLLCATLLVAPASTAASPTGSTTDALTRSGHTLPYKNPRLATKTRVADLLARMTLAEKVGQMAQAERADVAANPGQIAELGLGSVLSGGGSTPVENTPEAWADTVDAFQEQALSTRLGIPLLYGVDSVHGHGNLNGATVFPHNVGLGATRDPKLAERIGHITAEETRASGPQWNFAPCICVARDDRWGRTYESFGENPKLAAQMAQMIEGFQGDKGELDDPDRVLVTGWLKEKQGFDGLVISDWRAIHQIPGDVRRAGGHLRQRRRRHVHGAVLR